MPWHHLQARYRVVVKDFKWEIYPVDKFDVYNYRESRSLLNFVAHFLRDAERRGAYLKPVIEYRIPFFLYNSQNDFEQSIIADITEGTGGVTEAFKNRLLLGHRGSLRYLNHVVAHEYTHEIQFSILFEGWWKSARLLKFIFYPLWLMEGIAEYTSGDLDVPEREMYVRDAALNGKIPSIMKLHNFAHLEPHQVTMAYKTSELLMRFIAEEYGEEKLRELLTTFRENYDPNTVLSIVLGLDIKTLDFKFKEYLDERYENFRDLNKPVGEKLTSGQTKYPVFNFAPCPARGASLIYYLSDNRGLTEIWRTCSTSGKSEILVGLKNNAEIDYINPEGAALAISADGKKLAFIAEKNKKDFICVYDIATQKINKYSPGIDYSSLAAPAFFPDGLTIVFTAMVNSFRDLYTYNIATGETTRITFDQYDDTDPSVSPDGRYIVYSSERPKKGDFWDYDLFILDRENGRIEKLTNYDWDEKTPSVSPDGKTVVFIAEPDTVRNIYMLDLPTKNISKLTDTSGGFFNPVFADDGNSIIFSLFLDGRKDIYKIRNSELTTTKMEKEEETETATAPDENSAPNEETIKPYKFTASTDLFYPFLYYSSLDGLFLASYWLFSDMLGRHNLTTGVIFAEASKMLNYAVQYTFSRYRTQFIMNFSGDNTYYDWTNNRFGRYDKIILGVGYPFDRYRKLDFLCGAVFNKFSEPDKTEIIRDDLARIIYTKNTVSRKYLEPLAGNYFSASSSFALDAFGGASRKQNLSVENRNYYQLSGEHVMAWILSGAASFDKDMDFYSLGGSDRVRGFGYSRITDTMILVNTFELRIPVVSNINYYVWYLFPDFFFKSFFASLFIDSGLGWTENRGTPRKLSSWGVGLKLYSFILQSYPLAFKVEYAKPFSPDPEIWYFSIGSFFY